MQRRYAILDDNQRRLEERLGSLRVVLPVLLAARMAAAMVIGSVAAGRARDASDIDLVVVLREGSPTRADYGWWEAEVAPHLLDSHGFPVQPVIIGREALATVEPHLREALATGLRLWDPEEIFDDQPEARS